MLLDDNVFAVLTALVLIGSIIGVAMIIREGYVAGPSTAIGLLDENCRMGGTPSL